MRFIRCKRFFSPKTDGYLSPVVAAFICRGGFQELETELSGLKLPEPGVEADYNLNIFGEGWGWAVPRLL